jgi:ABC-2 type transport system permease protein
MTTTTLSQPNRRSHLRALWAIARKDWKQYWRYPLNAVSAVAQPLIWLTPVYFMGQVFSVNGQAQGFAAYSGTSDYMSFILMGTALSNFINSVFWGMGYSLKNDMDSGVLESNWLAPLPRPLLLIGRTFTSLIITGVTSLMMLLLAALLFGFNPNGNLLGALLAVTPMLLGLYGFGFAFAALVLIMRDANTLVDVSSFLAQIFSGSNFPINVLPRWLLPVSLALPLTYGFDAVRGLLLGTHTFLPIAAQIAILIVSMFALIALGSYAFRKLEYRVRMRGTLGQH